jgi:hypothetical protein
MGQTGEYSDHGEWPVAAFLDKAEAEARLAWCEEEASRLGVWSGGTPRKHRIRTRGDYVSAADPGLCVDYTGSDYYVMELRLLEKGRP